MRRAVRAMSSYAARDKKKGPFLNGPLDFTGTEAFRADVEFARFSAAYVNPDALDINVPAASRVAVRVADVISSHRSAAAAITEFGHTVSPLTDIHGTTNLCIVS